MVNGRKRLERVSTGAGGGHAVLDDTKHDQRGNSGQPQDAANHRPIIGLSRFDAFGRTACYAWKDQEENPMNIREVMTPNPRTVSPDDTIQSAARIMRDEDTGAIPVVENGRPVGMVTDRDIVVRAVADGGQVSRPVRDIVTTGVISVTPEMSTREANELMSEHQVRRLPVVENDQLVGIVSLGDLAVKEGKDRRTGDTLQDISVGVKERG